MVSYIRELEEKKRNTTHERNTPAGRYALASSQLGNFAHPVPAKIPAKHKSFSAKVVSTSIQSQLFFQIGKTHLVIKSDWERIKNSTLMKH